MGKKYKKTINLRIIEKQERCAQQDCPGERGWDISCFDIAFWHYVNLVQLTNHKSD